MLPSWMDENSLLFWSTPWRLRQNDWGKLGQWGLFVLLVWVIVNSHWLHFFCWAQPPCCLRQWLRLGPCYRARWDTEDVAAHRPRQYWPGESPLAGLFFSFSSSFLPFLSFSTLFILFRWLLLNWWGGFGKAGRVRWVTSTCPEKEESRSNCQTSTLCAVQRLLIHHLSSSCASSYSYNYMYIPICPEGGEPVKLSNLYTECYPFNAPSFYVCFFFMCIFI